MKNRIKVRVLLTRSTVLVMAFLFIQPDQVAAWQDDPFGTGSQIVPNVQSSNSAAIDPNLDPSLQLIIRAVRESEPASPLALARAIKSMVNIDQIDEAHIYLKTVGGVGDEW